MDAGRMPGVKLCPPGPRGQQQKRHEVPIFCPQVSCSTKTVCPHLLSFAADLFIEAFVLVLHTLSVPGPEPVVVCEGAYVCVYILVF